MQSCDGLISDFGKLKLALKPYLKYCIFFFVYYSSSYTVRPMRLEIQPQVWPFIWGILYPCGWKIIPSLSIYVIFIIPMWLENHTLVRDILHSQSMNFSPIHPFNISYSSFKFWVPFAEFHTYLVLFHRPLIHPFLNEFHDVMEWKSYPRDPFTPQNPSILCQKFIPCKQIKKHISNFICPLSEIHTL